MRLFNAKNHSGTFRFFTGSQMEIVLELKEEIDRMKKMRCTDHGKINVISTQADIDANTVAKKRTRMSAD